jgi:hypothetical protein
MLPAIPPRSTSSSLVVSAVLGHGPADNDRPALHRRTGRRGSCLGRIEHVQSPTMNKALSSPASDLLPRKPRRSMSPSRPVSPNFEEEKSYYGYEDADRDFEGNKSFYGYADMDQETKAGPRPRRDLADIPQVQVPKEKAPRRRSALEQVQVLLEQIEESVKSEYGYEDMDAIRKLNGYMHSISSEHSTMRRRGGSACDRTEALNDTAPSQPPSRRSSMNEAHQRGRANGSHAMSDTAPSQPPSHRGKVSVGSSYVAVKEHKNGRATILRNGPEIGHAVRRGSCLGRIQHASPSPFPSPCFLTSDYVPRSPCRSTSATRFGLRG